MTRGEVTRDIRELKKAEHKYTSRGFWNTNLVWNPRQRGKWPTWIDVFKGMPLTWTSCRHFYFVLDVFTVEHSVSSSAPEPVEHPTGGDCHLIKDGQDFRRERKLPWDAVNVPRTEAPPPRINQMLSSQLWEVSEIILGWFLSQNIQWEKLEDTSACRTQVLIGLWSP